MTELQIDYMRAQEQERANRASEEEKHRANTENERITEAYNHVREELERIRLDQHERELALREVDSMLKRAELGDRQAFDELLEMDGEFTDQDFRSKAKYWSRQSGINSKNVVEGVKEALFTPPAGYVMSSLKDMKYILS